MIPDLLENEIREYLVELMPLEHAPAHLRLAFHDAGSFDQPSGVGGAHAAVRMTSALRRAENAGWGAACFELLAEVRERYPHVSWADLIALGGAAAVQKCGGPVMRIGLGRTDASEALPEHQLPSGNESPARLKTHFTKMGMDARHLVALSGAHTLGHASRRPFTPDPWVFSNSYFKQLLTGKHDMLLLSDQSLLRDAELRALVELYAEDEACFRADFADAYRRLTWLGNTPHLIPD